MNRLPIITTFRVMDPQKDGIPGWAMISLIQARLTNPHAPIYIITNQKELFERTQFPILNSIEVIDLETLQAASNRLHDVYFHLSINNYVYERCCIERWFLINEFVKQRGITQFFHMDTDVMLFCDITESAKRFAGYRGTALGYGSWGTAHFLDATVLPEFCDMVVEFYERKTWVWMEGARKIGLFNPAMKVDNISDMFFVGFYHENYVKNHKETFIPCSNPMEGRIFDPHMNIDEPGVEMENGVKKLYWKNGEPYTKFKDREEYLKMDCLHFQGGAKDLIGPVFNKSLKEMEEYDAQRAYSIKSQILSPSLLQGVPSL